MIEIISVRFKNGGKQYYFNPNGLKFAEGDGVIVESPRGKVEAIAMVTIRIRPFHVMGRTVHLIGMPFAYGWTTPGCGDSTNRLTIAACDPNTTIPELKACCVNIRKAGRLTEIA